MDHSVKQQSVSKSMPASKGASVLSLIHDHGGITSIPGDGQGVWVTFFLNVPHGSLSCKIASGCKYKPKYLQHFNWRQELSNQTVKVPHVKVALVAWDNQQTSMDYLVTEKSLYFSLQGFCFFVHTITMYFKIFHN